MPIRCLSIHAPYVCAHAGACCTAGWRIPVDERIVEPLRTFGFQIGIERVAPVSDDGRCVFFEPDKGRLCAIHRRAGPALLPAMCRNFPRVVVNDPRGTSVTLSHFCPTAAALLFEHVPLAIVDAPPPVSLDGNLEGLDATDVLPPLLSRNVLTDWNGYSAWEDAAVALLDVDGLEPERAVDLLTRVTEDVCGWTPERESLTAAVRRSFSEIRAIAIRGKGRWRGYERPVNAFLAAHAFASWAAYEKDGLRAVPAAVGNALAVLTREAGERGSLTRESLIESMRAADLRLRHSIGAVPTAE